MVETKESFMTEPMRVCVKCHFELPLSEFTITDRSKGYRRGSCKKCESARVRAYYAANSEYRVKQLAATSARNKAHPKSPQEARRALLKHKYGLTPEQFDQLLAMQGGKCALCGAPNHGRKPRGVPGGHNWLVESWPVDHCHKDGRVRGLLCHPCNTKIGGYEALLDQVGEARLLEYLSRPSPLLALPVPVVVEAPPPRFVADLPPRYTRGTCTICGADQHANGLCFRHYMRARRRGDPSDAPRAVRAGEAHHKATLTESQAREIKFGTARGAELARRFGVKPSVVSSIRHGLTWKHLQPESVEATMKPEIE
jgi:hypothetical protein